MRARLGASPFFFLALAAVEDGRAYLCFGRPKDAPGAHMGQRLQAAVAALGGKGGGAPDLAQGSGTTTADLQAVLARAAEGP